MLRPNGSITPGSLDRVFDGQLNLVPPRFLLRSIYNPIALSIYFI